MTDTMLPGLLLSPLHGMLAGWRVLDGLLSRSLNGWSFIRVNYAGDRSTEQAIEGGVASFGRQLGIVEEALRELARGLPGEKVERLEAMMQAIEWVKEERLSREPSRQTSRQANPIEPVRPAFAGATAD